MIEVRVDFHDDFFYPFGTWARATMEIGTCYFAVATFVSYRNKLGDWEATAKAGLVRLMTAEMHELIEALSDRFVSFEIDIGTARPQQVPWFIVEQFAARTHNSTNV